MRKSSRYGKIVFATTSPVMAVPVVPNFQQMPMTSRTETQSTVTETINSIDMRTGWEYSVTAQTFPTMESFEPTSEQINSKRDTKQFKWSSGRKRRNRNSNKFVRFLRLFPTNFTITNPGRAFQFTQSYQTA